MFLKPEKHKTAYKTLQNITAPFRDYKAATIILQFDDFDFLAFLMWGFADFCRSKLNFFRCVCGFGESVNDTLKTF